MQEELEETLEMIQEIVPEDPNDDKIVKKTFWLVLRSIFVWIYKVIFVKIIFNIVKYTLLAFKKIVYWLFDFIMGLFKIFSDHMDED